MRTRFMAALSATCLTLLLAAPLATAQDPAGTPVEVVQRTPAEIQKTYRKLAKEFMSPYCPGATLADCGSGQAAKLRDEVRGWVEAGRSEASIRDELVVRFGESILGAPTFRGSNILVWVAPIIVLVLGAVLVFGYLRLQTKRSAEDGATKTAPQRVSSDLDRRVEEELQARVR